MKADWPTAAAGFTIRRGYGNEYKDMVRGGRQQSTGRQRSDENRAWCNGAFTNALVGGLDGRADHQRSGRITHKILDLYISCLLYTSDAADE